MKKQSTLFVVVCVICFLFYRCNTSADNASAKTDSSSAANMYAGYASETEWGHHLVSVGGCGDCHTPKKMTAQGPVDDSSLLLAGNLAQVPAPEISGSEMAKHIAATYDNTSWVGPWGKSYAANLTPDSTGILGWSEQQFITCIKKGLFKGIEGSRPLMPPMPVKTVRNFTNDELKAMFAYLKTIKPVHNIVPDYQSPSGTSH